MPNEREYRAFSQIVQRDLEEEEKSYIVEGYASTFDPYVLFTNRDGVDIHELWTR